MFAIVDIAGFQEKAVVGEKLRVPTLECEPGKTLTFDNVLLIAGDNGEVTIGAPYVEGKSVEVKVLEHDRDDKIRVVRFRRHKRFLRVKGHRQGKTVVEVVKIA